MQALEHLRKNEHQIVDKLSVLEYMGDLYIKLGQQSTAIPIFEELIRRNPENTLYYSQYFEACQITDNCEKKLEAFKKFQDLYPRAMCPKRLPLNVAKGESFKELLDKYLRQSLRKGVPPLFVNIRSLHQDPDKISIIEDLSLQYYSNLIRSGHFSREDADNNLPPEPASALVWTILFLAQHYDYMRNSDKALEFVNAAIEHTPTLIELFMTKGRIFKHAGDPIEAYKWLDEAQSMDTADR